MSDIVNVFRLVSNYSQLMISNSVLSEHLLPNVSMVNSSTKERLYEVKKWMTVLTQDNERPKVWSRKLNLEKMIFLCVHVRSIWKGFYLIQ